MNQPICPTCNRPLPNVAESPLDRIAKLIYEEVYSETGISSQLLVSRSNEAHLVAARSLFAVKARNKNLSYPQIGRILRRHHTTVMHGVRTYTQKLAA
jgi:chromosomal replication initiation ATPase DnaA